MWKILFRQAEQSMPKAHVDKEKNQMNFSKLSTHLVLLCFPFVIIKIHYIIKKKKKKVVWINCVATMMEAWGEKQLKDKGQYIYIFFYHYNK
jgi:hypothetical protein